MPNIFLRSFLTLPPPPRSTLFPYTTLFRSRLRFRIRREVRARSGSDQFRLAGALEERESRTSLPSLWPAQADPVLERHVVDSRDQRFIVLLALPMPGEISQVCARRENHIDPRHRRNLFRVFHADGRLNHNHHHHIVIGDLTIVASPQGAVLPVALAAPAFWRIFGPLYIGLRLFHGVHGRNDDSDRANVGRFLNVALSRVRHADKWHRRSPSAGPNHFRHIPIGPRAVLHLDPQKIVSGVGHRAVNVGVWRKNRGANNRLAFTKFLLRRVENPHRRLLLLHLRFSPCQAA